MYETSIRTERNNFRIEDLYYNGIIRRKSDIDISGTKEVLCQHIQGDDKPGQIVTRLLRMRHDETVKALAAKFNINLTPYLQVKLT